MAQQTEPVERRVAVKLIKAGMDSRRVLDQEPVQARAAVAKEMQRWLADPDFTGVRGRGALAKLPEAERSDWQRLWEEVENRRQRAAGPAATTGPPRP
jgi:hypothetical protein